ncbi:MAG: chemotaxis protein CheC [Promethearchaeota archaeon]
MTKEKLNLLKGKDSIDLNSIQIDSLKELGNIGCGNAVTALSKLLNRRIEMSLTKVSIIPFWKITSITEDLGIEVFGIFSDIKGNANLSIFQFFTKRSILEMVEFLAQNYQKVNIDIKDLSDLDEFTYSIIMEIGNILAGHYTSALANLMNIKLIPNVPNVALDTLKTILNTLSVEISQSVNHLLVIETEIEIEVLKLNGHFLFIPDLNTLQRIFKAINIDYKFEISE